MPGPRKTALLQLKKDLKELHAANQARCNSQEANTIGRALDVAYRDLQEGLRRQDKAAADLQDTLGEYQKAVDNDRKAAEAYLENKDKSEESWLEQELPVLAKITQTKAVNYQAAREELADAQKAIPKLQTELDKCEKADADFFAVTQKVLKEAEGMEKKIQAVEKDLKDYPSLGRKIKDLLK